MLSYGRVITEELYQNGNVVRNVVQTEASIRVHGLQELWDNLIQQVGRLKTEDSITFTIEADLNTRQPVRILLNSKHQVK